MQTVDVALSTRTIRSVLALDGRPVAGGAVSFGSVFDASRSSGKIQLVSQRPGGAQQSRMLGIGGATVRATVAADGSFEVDGVADDLLWMTWYAGDGSYLGRLWPADPVPRMDLSGVRVTGSLLDVNGTPVGGQVSLTGDLGRTVAWAEAGEDGRFELPPAPPAPAASVWPSKRAARQRCASRCRWAACSSSAVRPPTARANRSPFSA